MPSPSPPARMCSLAKLELLSLSLAESDPPTQSMGALACHPLSHCHVGDWGAPSGAAWLDPSPGKLQLSFRPLQGSQNFVLSPSFLTPFLYTYFLTRCIWKPDLCYQPLGFVPVPPLSGRTAQGPRPTSPRHLCLALRMSRSLTGSALDAFAGLGAFPGNDTVLEDQGSQSVHHLPRLLCGRSAALFASWRVEFQTQMNTSISGGMEGKDVCNEGFFLRD